MRMEDQMAKKHERTYQMYQAVFRVRLDDGSWSQRYVEHLRADQLSNYIMHPADICVEGAVLDPPLNS